MRFVLVLVAGLCMASAAWGQERSYFGFQLGMSEAQARAAAPGQTWSGAIEPGAVSNLYGRSPRFIGGLVFMPILQFSDGRLSGVTMYTAGPHAAERCRDLLQTVVVNFEREFGAFDGGPGAEEYYGEAETRVTERGSRLRFYAHPQLGDLGFAASTRGELVEARSRYLESPTSDRLPCTASIDVSPPPAPLPPEPSAAALEAAPMLERSQWVERPGGADFARVYPPMALDLGIEGRVVLDCLVQEGGRLLCAAATEEPADIGFGEAARALAPAFRIAEAIDGAPTLGMRVRIPIRFNVAQ
ncbi:MAG TPA: TonB family protein [Terricaulis sp.]|nr:TonB family protein [Terricaulis sp.]